MLLETVYFAGMVTLGALAGFVAAISSPIAAGPLCGCRRRRRLNLTGDNGRCRACRGVSNLVYWRVWIDTQRQRRRRW